jgi:anti-sigma regulatory factor (Ser/Thr protein kinase)
MRHDPAQRQPGRAEPSTRHAAGMFRRDTAEVRRARSFVRSSLTSWGLPQQVPALELAVSELVTNALVHGKGDIEVLLTACRGVVRLEVADHGDGGRPRIHRCADDGEHEGEHEGEHGGWGLKVVQELSDTWGTASGRAETRVWMERTSGGSGSV